MEHEYSAPLQRFRTLRCELQRLIDTEQTRARQRFKAEEALRALDHGIPLTSGSQAGKRPSLAEVANSNKEGSKEAPEEARGRESRVETEFDAATQAALRDVMTRQSLIRGSTHDSFTARGLELRPDIVARGILAQLGDTDPQKDRTQETSGSQKDVQRQNERKNIGSMGYKGQPHSFSF